MSEGIKRSLFNNGTQVSDWQF